MKTLIIKNITTEGPGTIEDYLKTLKVPYRIVDLYKGEPLPDLEGFSHIVIMGGPMAVYEMDKYPFLKDEALFIQKAIKAGKHILGVCLGAQMIAHILGARVYPGNEREIGWYSVSLTEEAIGDPVISELAVDDKHAVVFQWHGDTFDLPEGAVRLASSELYPNQAFKFSDKVYAIQFHIEVTRGILKDWFENEKDVDIVKILNDTDSVFASYHKKAYGFYRKFFTLRYTKRN